MYKFFTLLFACVLFTISLAAQDMYRVTGDDINVRETNSTKGKVIGSLPANENVQVLDSSDAKFFKIKVTNGEGYVSSAFLTKIASAPIKKAEQQEIKIVTPKTTNSNANLAFVAIVALIIFGLLFFIFKFLTNNIPLLVLSTILVLAIGYFSFTMLFTQKAVSGKYTSTEDLQYQTFEFKSKDSVVVLDTYADSVFTAKYTVQDDMVKFKQQENTFILMIRDNNTLVGEGFTKGIFKKN
jgi:hypothetical protein